LRKLSRDKQPESYIRMLDKAHRFSETVEGSVNFMQDLLEKSNAFKEPTDAKLKII
jgi:hypothetical protein